MVKVESGLPLSSSQTAELAFLRSRVRDLEREKAEMGAENQRLRAMLVNGELRPADILVLGSQNRKYRVDRITIQLQKYTTYVYIYTIREE